MPATFDERFGYCCRYRDTVQWITDVAVPIALGLLAAFGATWYSNRKSAERLKRDDDERAAGAIRAYIRVLRETSDYLEARAMAYGDWDPAKDVINHGGQSAVRDAFNGAAPYFHRLDMRPADKNPLRNEFPAYGEHPMDGAGSFYQRANEIQAVLDRGLKGQGRTRRGLRSPKAQKGVGASKV